MNKILDSCCHHVKNFLFDLTETYNFIEEKQNTYSNNREIPKARNKSEISKRSWKIR